MVGCLVLGVSVVGSAFILSSQKREEAHLVNQSLSVTGRATKFVTADTLKWSLSLTREGVSSSTEQTLVRDLDNDVEFIKQKLVEAGATDITVSRQPYRYTKGYCYDNSYPIYDDYRAERTSGTPEPVPPQPSTQTCGGGSIYQTVIFETKNADKANGVTGSMAGFLSDRKTWMSDSQTLFIISNDEDLRRELIDTALRDAREKADKIAPGKVGPLLRALDEQMVITAKNASNDYYYGSDQSSVEKKAVLTLPVSFIAKK